MTAERRTETLIVMPAFNEELVVGNTVKETMAELPGFAVLVVDDGSSDKTAEIARDAGALVLTLPFNLGVGGAMRAGFKFAVEFGFTNVVQIDADGQHDPRYVPELLALLSTNDIAIGARFAGKGEYHVRGPRKWAMKFLSVCLSAISHAKLTDTTSGFKAMGPSAVKLFAKNFPAEYLGDTVEALVIASRHNLRVTQMPVSMRNRSIGLPSQSPLRAAIYLGRAFIALFVGLSRKY